MAARLNPAPSRPPEIVELRRLSARDLEPLLREETAAWWETLDWDFEKSADLVRRFVDLRALNGYALVEDGLAVGYIYYVLEEGKGLMGDLYVMREHRTIERENLLLSSALHSIVAHPHVTRIESQLMMLEFSSSRAVPGAAHLSAFDRNFMRIDLRRWRSPPPTWAMSIAASTTNTGLCSARGDSSITSCNIPAAAVFSGRLPSPRSSPRAQCSAESPSPAWCRRNSATSRRSASLRK